MRTEQEERNIKAVVDFYEVVINGQQYDRAGEFLDGNYIQHKPEVETGVKGVLDFVRLIYVQAPDHNARIIRSFADGDYVILHVHVTNGLEAKSIAVMDIFRVENAMLMEHWDVACPVAASSKNENGVF
jgi:predicted SnoaL-like aldol condensation-catalyzing enzyme